MATDKIPAKATGRLAHHFWGDYCATIALVFKAPEHAALALPLLGSGWRRGKNRGALVWHGTGAELRECKSILAAFGADPDAIDSVAHSVDFGDDFAVTIPVENPDQLSPFRRCNLDPHAQAVLDIIRGTQREGHWVMRELHPEHPAFAAGKCAIVNVGIGAYRCPIPFQGQSWEEVHSKMLASANLPPSQELVNEARNVLSAARAKRRR